jgi:hypothetical protein
MSYTAVTKAGFDSLQWGYRSTAGYFTGGVTNLAATDTGDSSNMTRYNGALNANITLPTPTEVNILGDDTRIAIFQFDGTENIAFDMEMSVNDFRFLAAISGVANVTESAEVMQPFGMTGVTRAGMILLFSSKAKSQDSGTLNSAGYSHLLLMNCEVTDLGAGSAHQAGSTRRYRVTANLSDTLPDGRTVATVFPTVPGGKCAGIEFHSVNRVSYAVLVGDAAEDTITTAYDPVSTATTKATVETTGFAAATVSSVSALSIVLNAAPGSGKFAPARYEFVSF